MVEDSNAFTMVFLDLSSLQTNVYTILRITDWQHWVFVIAQVAPVSRARCHPVPGVVAGSGTMQISNNICDFIVYTHHT